MLKILQLTPTYFSPESNLGGGERYPLALAEALSREHQVRLISFGRKSSSMALGPQFIQRIYGTRHWWQGNILNPQHVTFLRELGSADIVHAHQINTMVSDLAALGQRWRGKPIFLTDHGGGGAVVLNRRLPWLHDWAQVILQSEFTRAFVPPRLRERAVVIRGGVDTKQFCPDSSVAKDGTILFVGRILPHKGIDVLIEAFRHWGNPAYRLKIVGRVYDQRYERDLRKQAEGLAVEFVAGVGDEDLVGLYRRASVTVLPSVHTDAYGNYTATPELMGFTLTESQACGTPVIASAAGAMREFIREGVTGRVVPERDPCALAEALSEVIVFDPSACRAWAEEMSWERVAAAHLDLYRRGS